MTLVEMLEKNAKNYPEKIAIAFHELRIGYQQLNEMVNRLANGLLGLGIKKGDRVGLMLPKIPEMVISFLGIAKCGAIAAPFNYELQPDRIGELLKETQPFCLVVHESFVNLVQQAIPSFWPTHIIVVGDYKREPFFSWWAVLNGSNTGNPNIETTMDGVVYLNYTSGSTGESKGAITTHANIYWNTVAAVNALRLTHDDIHLCMFAPFAHPHEIFARPLYLGGTMVLLDNVYPKSLAKAISDNGVTCMMGLAPMYEKLLDVAGEYDLGSLRIPESGGMYTRVDLIQRFEKRVGVPILPVWGSTETTGIAIADSPSESLVDGSVGRPCPCYEVKVVDEEGIELPPGEVGELIFRGPAVVSGYYRRPNETMNSFKDGWYYSGDLGRMDDDRNFYFVERKSGMLKVGGLKVYPLEVEIALMEHPMIKEVAVIGAPDRLRGEVPKAIVVLSDGIRLTERDIFHFCKERMARYKIPRVIEFRDALPKIGSGKINKKALKEEANIDSKR